jgi:hypothetical protein
MRSLVRSGLLLVFVMTCAATAVAQTNAHPANENQSSENCCGCSQPPGGIHCCQNPNDFVGCVVEKNQCRCVCFVPDGKDDSIGTQSDHVLRMLLGDVPSNATPDQRIELFKRILKTTEQGESYATNVNGEQLQITVRAPKQWKRGAEIYRKPPLRERLFTRGQFTPPQSLIIDKTKFRRTTTITPP